MSFVPLVPRTTTPRARALAKEIEKTIEEHCARESRTTDQDVRRALQLASSRRGGADGVILLVMVVLGLIVFLLASGSFFSQR